MASVELQYANTSKGGSASPMMSDERAALGLPVGGKWSYAARMGRLFLANEGAGGQVLPIFSNTAQKFALWNPAGSGVNLNLVKLTSTYVATTGAAGGFCIGIMKNAGAALATGGVSVFTETQPERAPYGGPVGGGKVRFALTATVIAPTILCQIGMNQLVLTAADATNPQWSFEKNFDGEMVIAPNNLIVLAGNIATLVTMASSLWYTEDPI